eukprot:CAMPEP_0204633050 /NCGR_PEP_ID=MMETSP0717-20131115/26287_1 /ASSEMBLY_ACC=CAM_ASM_000666 /TAXON_ID=230516 /ORGANISM="Chaetoceros curvisetus" /LENGTH=34 /DNA_ID= /DNA_START= /DNA_END= /DNA_ORIENTATION=
MSELSFMKAAFMFKLRHAKIDSRVAWGFTVKMCR